MGRVLCALLICSDQDCAEELEAWADTPGFERLACACGCVLEPIAFYEAEPAVVGDEVPPNELPLAA